MASATVPMVVRQVPLEWGKGTYLAVVIVNVFTPEECNELIARSEQAGYEMALVNIGGGRQMQAGEIRNNDRCIIDDADFAAEIWKRIQVALNMVDEETSQDLQLGKLKKLEYERNTWHAVGLNERLRILRYDPGTYFKPHFDGSYVRGMEAGEERKHETSFVTCQLYLNQEFEGGETTFQQDSIFDILRGREPQEYSVVPETGSVLLFQHDLLHEGSSVRRGRKYVIRTDVMYTNKGPGHEYTNRPLVLQSTGPNQPAAPRMVKRKAFSSVEGDHLAL